MSEQTRRIAEGILDRLNVSTKDFAALNAHLHSEHAAGYKAGVLAGLKWAREEREFCDGLPGRPAFLPTLDDAIAHVEATGKLPEEKEVPW
jgi:hypothetical protein